MSGYAFSSFGNGTLTGSGGNVTSKVHTHFGPRTPDTDGNMGVNKVEGMKEELVIHLTGEMYASVADTLMPYVLPAGAVIKDVYIDVEEVFAVGGTSTPRVVIGTEGTEATNGFVISEAILEATGSANLTSTLAGTWDNEAPLAANTKIGIAMAGTNPTLSTSGKARITVLFHRINRAPSPALDGGPVLP